MKLFPTTEYNHLEDKYKNNGNGKFNLGKGPDVTIYVLYPSELNCPLSGMRGSGQITYGMGMLEQPRKHNKLFYVN